MQEEAWEKGQDIAINFQGEASSCLDAPSVVSTEAGERAQRVSVDGIEVMAPLPGLRAAPRWLQGAVASGKRKAPSNAQMEKVSKRRELYGRIYSEIGEALDSQKVANGEDGEDDEDNSLLQEARQVSTTCPVSALK